MRSSRWIMAACALLAACSDDARRQTPSRSSPQDTVSPAPRGPERHILAFGDSLFAGYRLGPGQGYPERLQDALRKRGINARVTNAGVSGDTTAAGLQRLNFVLDSLDGPADIVIVELGGNDLLRGISPAETRANLASILRELHKRGSPVLLMGMRAPPNTGTQYVADFDAIYPSLAHQYGDRLVPFFQAPIYDKPQLLQPDHIHPNARGVEALVSATVDTVAAALPKPR